VSVGICIRHTMRHTGSAAEAPYAVSWEALLRARPLQPLGNTAPRTGITRHEVLLQKEGGSLLTKQMLNTCLERCSNSPGATRLPYSLPCICTASQRQQKAQAGQPKHSIDFWSINCSKASLKHQVCLPCPGQHWEVNDLLLPSLSLLPHRSSLLVLGTDSKRRF